MNINEKIFKYKLNDILELKKEHPCFKRSNLFEVIRLGADIRIKCLGCGKTFLISRDDLNKKIKKVIQK